MTISKGDYVKIKGQKEFIKVNSIYIDTKELGCPQILELENNYKIASYNLLIEVLKVLIIDEDKKQRLNKGGKSKTMRKKSKSTKRNTLKK